VTSVDVSGGTTGLTFTGGPVTTAGVITMAGTLAPASGGTGLAALGPADTVLGVNAAGTTPEYKALTAGTGMTVVHTANTVTFNNTGVTSVGLALPTIFTVSGTPVTTSGTLTGALALQTANTVFAGPATGVDAAPTFRALTPTDVGFDLYVENSTGTPVVTAAGVDAQAFGNGASASIYGSKAFANGSFAAPGDAQHGVYVLRNVTTGATPTALFLDGAAQSLVFPINSVATFDILVTARRTDAVGGGAGYRFVGAIKKDDTVASTTFVGTPSKTILGETDVLWDVNVTANTVNGSLTVTVTGEAAKTIRWVATVMTTEVTN
jgi:hypothetical protein